MEDLKLLIAGLLSPLWIALLLQVIGVVILRRRQTAGVRLLVAGFVVLVVGSLSGLTFEIRRSAEFQYSPMDVSLQTTVNEEKTLICVLGTGFNPDSALPANSRVSGGFLSRLLEGVRLYRALPKSHLVISVAGDASVEDKRTFLTEMQKLLQLDPNRVQLVTESKSTLDEAMEVKAITKGEHVIVVTSAGHMPRAMTTFTGEGLTPSAAPADYGFVRKGSSRDKIWPRWIPSLEGIGANHQWLYERAALVWQRIARKQK